MFSLKILKRMQITSLLFQKKNNLLFSIAKNYNLFYTEHNHNIGGRYSVLSEVGVIPAYLMGVIYQNWDQKYLISL